MKKNTFLTTFALGLALIPMFASAETNATATLQISINAPTEAQVFTACSQTSIEVRDEAIGSARTAYNNSMSVALDARKEAEKKAVAIEDADQKKEAIRVAVENYKKAVTEAQDTLTEARKEAWDSFETNTQGCRDGSKDKRQAVVAEKKIAAPQKSEVKMLQTNLKADAKVAATAMKVEADTKTEVKTFRTVIKDQIDSIKAFFGFKASTDASVETK